MFRCEVCHNVVKQRQPMHRHPIFREVPHRVTVLGITETKTRKEIAKELGVCLSCHAQLEHGVPLLALQRRHAPPPPPKPEPAKVQPIYDPVCLPIGKPVELLGKVVRYKR